jgi:outer membrane protein assembly factor BamB
VRLSGPPWAEGGSVYLGLSTRILAVSALTGERQWTADVPCSAGPVMAAELVCGGGPDGTLSALKPRSGAIRWQQRLGGSAITSLATADDVLYAGTADGQIHAVKPADGSVAWRWRGPGTLTRPLVSDGVLFVGSSDGAIYAVNALTGQGPKIPRSTPKSG